MWREVSICLSVYWTVKSILWAIQRYKDHQTFRKLGIKGPEPSFLSGNVSELHSGRKLRHEILGEWIESYGSVFGYYMGGKPYLIINDEDLLQQVFISRNSSFRNRPDMVVDAEPLIYSLVALKDESWKRVRRVISPVFSQHKVLSPDITNEIEGCVERAVAALKSRSKNQKDDGSFESDVYPVMQATTLDVILRTAVNMKTHNVHDEKDEILDAVRMFFSEAQNTAVDLAMYLPFLKPIMTFINNHLTSGKMTDMVVRHLKQQITIELETANDRKGSKTFLSSLIKRLETNELSKNEVIGNAHIVLLAGYETTATSVTFAIHLLARHPEIQQKLRNYFLDERNQTTEDGDYFEKVWLETLRILPPVPLFVVREASEGIFLKDILIPKGVVIQAPVWQLHHRDDLWSDPWTFDPEHFSPNIRETIHPMAFLPFGAGPHICLGMHLALQEAKLILRKILVNYRIETDTPELKLKSATVFINPADNVCIRFIPIIQM